MVTKILNYRFIQYALSTLIVLGAVIIVFTPNYFLFKMGSRFAIQIMLGYLFLGFVFMAFRLNKLMFTSFACCAGLCLFLKYASDGQLTPPLKTNALSINVAHFNVAASNSDIQTTIDEILEVDADVISFQEVTPDWDYILSETLKETFPYAKSVVRFDPHGLAIYSKYPLVNVDTFMYEDIPNIIGSIYIDDAEKEICFISSHTNPAFYTSDYERQRNHLMAIADHASHSSCPVITLGDYNAVPWSYEIRNFKSAAKLNDSRKGYMPSSNGTFSLFQIPSDHIFYSEHFKCLNFQEISDPEAGHLGLKGTYQFNEEKPSAKPTM